VSGRSLPVVTRIGGLLLLKVDLAALKSCNESSSRHHTRRQACGGAFLYSGNTARAETAADATERPVEGTWTGLRLRDSGRSRVTVIAGLLRG